MTARLGKSLNRLMDMAVAATILILAAPLFLVISILIKLDSPGSVFYRQTRVGQNRRKGDRRRCSQGLRGDRRNGDRRKKNQHGQLFVIYKFRSMRRDAEKKSGPVRTQTGDPRITKVGKLLRLTRADELPQLYNVLKGEMSLVGPRPERPAFVTQFMGNVPRYHERLQVKPGLIGLAQAMNGDDTCLQDVRRELFYDLKYIQRRSFRQDMKILIQTLTMAA